MHWLVVLAFVASSSVRLKSQTQTTGEGDAQADASAEAKSRSQFLLSDTPAKIGQLQNGTLLRGRYRLEMRLRGRSSMPQNEKQRKAGYSRLDFPIFEDEGRRPWSLTEARLKAVNKDRKRLFSDQEWEGRGSFRDVWKAKDYAFDPPRWVAVKIFHRQNNGYLTWANAEEGDIAEMETNEFECDRIKEILKPDRVRLYPVGASRICACYDQYITDARETGMIVFMVEEFCGTNLEKGYLARRKNTGTVNFIKARLITKQMIQAIAFLQMLTPEHIHHDLKPENVCVTENDGEAPIVKLIDWGGLVWNTPAGMIQAAALTIGFAPPEVLRREVSTYALPPHSYDSFAVGIMHMYLICPFISGWDHMKQINVGGQPWYDPHLMTRDYVAERLAARCGDKEQFPEYVARGLLEQDAEIISALSHVDPTARPDPVTALGHPGFKDIRTPIPVVEQERQVIVMQFKRGQPILYQSASTGELVPGIVREVYADEGYYVLVQEHPEEPNLDKKRLLHEHADPVRVRPVERARPITGESLHPKPAPVDERPTDDIRRRSVLRPPQGGVVNILAAERAPPPPAGRAPVGEFLEQSPPARRAGRLDAQVPQRAPRGNLAPIDERTPLREDNIAAPGRQGVPFPVQAQDQPPLRPGEKRLAADRVHQAPVVRAAPGRAERRPGPMAVAERLSPVQEEEEAGTTNFIQIPAIMVYAEPNAHGHPAIKIKARLTCYNTGNRYSCTFTRCTARCPQRTRPGEYERTHVLAMRLDEAGTVNDETVARYDDDQTRMLQLFEGQTCTIQAEASFRDKVTKTFVGQFTSKRLNFIFRV